MAGISPERQTSAADDYARALDQLEADAVRNTLAILRRSLDGVLTTLRRSYQSYLNDLGPMSRDPSGQLTRRDGAYTIAESTAKFRGILQDAQQFMTPQEVNSWRDSYERNLEDAAKLGGQLANELVEMVSQDPASVPFTGADPLAMRAVASNAAAFIQYESARFRNQIVEIVGEGVARGWGPSRLERQLRDALRGARDPKKLNERLGLEQRAALIARSELSHAYAKATKDAAKKRGDKYVRLLASNDERVCPTCASRNGRVYAVDRISVPLHPRCVLGETKVSPGLLAAAFRSVYRGNVVTIRLANGEVLTVTVDHPVLTPAGWVKAEAIRSGDQLIGHGFYGPVASAGGSPDLHQVPATAEDVFAAFAEASAVSTMRVPVSPLDLHGDGEFIHGDVEVVRAESLFEGYWDTASDQCGAELDVVERRVRFRPFTTFSHADAAILGLGAAASGSVGRLREALAILRGGLGHAEIHRLAAAAWGDPVLGKELGDCASLYPELGGDGLDADALVVELQRLVMVEDRGVAPDGDACRDDVAPDNDLRAAELLSDSFDAKAGLIELHDVVAVELNAFHGFVYTFETFCGAYATGESARVVNKNCRCVLSYVPNEAVDESDPELQDVLLDSERWRAEHERGVEAYAKAKDISMEKARQELDRALRTPTAAERRLNRGRTDTLGESVRLFS